MDYQATTPVDPRVLDAMLPYFRERFGNAASNTHAYGWEAQAAVKAARAQCARAIGADPIDVLFTSGSTEGINVALKGAFELDAAAGDHMITCVTEHPAVIDSARFLESRGVDVTWLGVDRDGRIDLGELEASFRDRTRLVALMAANNEIGTTHPLRRIGELCREHRALFFCDATQGVGKLPLDVDRDHIDVLSFSGHKLYGPKGIGALYVRHSAPHVRLHPLQHGGGHERGMRSGTLNVPGIVGIGLACELAAAELEDEIARLTRLRHRLHDGIAARIDHVTLNGHPEQRLPGNLNLAFGFCDGEALIMDMKDVAVSSGAACSSADREPSHVLRAIGRSADAARASIRFGLGRMTTELEIDRVIELVVGAVARLRAMSPLYEMERTRHHDDGGNRGIRPDPG